MIGESEGERRGAEKQSQEEEFVVATSFLVLPLLLCATAFVFKRVTRDQ